MNKIVKASEFEAGRVEQVPVTDRVSWLAMRANDVTASDVAAVCGADPRRSALRVFAEKTGTIPPTEENEVMRRGRWMEAAVFEALAETYPHWEIRRAKVYLRDPVLRIGATPDGVAVDPAREGFGIIQCKVVSRPVFEAMWRDGGDDVATAPVGYQLQTITEAKLAGASWAMLAALVVDTFTADLECVPVDIHDGAFAKVCGHVQDFWQLVAKGTPPAADYRLDDDTIKQLYPRDTGEMLDLQDDNRGPELLKQIERLKDEIKVAENLKNSFETELKEKIGEASGAYFNGWQVTHKLQERGAYEVKATSFRVLRSKRT
jgi:predicted phage-related endonuclease